MACTIDHLRIDLRVTVLRDFTDLAGLVIRAGERGVIRGLGLEIAPMEIWIDLERDGDRTTLRFALAAKDGPRNGRMRDYFALDEPAEVPTPASPQSTPPSPDPIPAPRLSPQRPPVLLHPRMDKQAPDNTSLAETRVACDCDPAFHREILPSRSELTVAACLRCGTLTCSRSFGDDGRFTGKAWQENRSVALPEQVHRWLGGWPRVKVDHASPLRWPMSADYARYPTLFYPPETRCGSLAELADIEARLARQQAGQRPGTRLAATHRVTTPSPDSLPDSLVGYRMLWQALQLGPDSDLAELVHHAQPRSPGCDITAEHLAQRPDAFERIVEFLASPNATRRGVGYLIARNVRPPDPRLAGVLIAMLNELSLTPAQDMPDGIADRSKGELLLLLVADLQMATPEILATLRTRMRTFARHDPFLAQCAGIVLRELATQPAHAAPTPIP